MADIILGIESSCDDTSAAVIKDGVLLSNVIASQDVHKTYGGVVPELASRAHELNIVPVVSEALSRLPFSGYVIRQGSRDFAWYPYRDGQSPSGTCPCQFRKAAGQACAGAVIPLSVPACERRQFPDCEGGRPSAF